MQTLIFPGFSLKNKDWAEKIKQRFEPGIPTTIVYWPHWETGKREHNWIENEAKKIVEQQDSINILAHSIGTAVAMVVLKLNPQLVTKLILTGIPLANFEKGDEQYYKPLTSFSAEKVLCIQNENDKYGSYYDAEKLVHSFNPKINIISKPGSSHEYSYFEDFETFLASFAPVG